MDGFPRVTDQDFVERAGVNFVAGVVNEARCIWRETLQRDIGIDGHIEYVTAAGQAPGRLIAVQVKSGPSRFSHASDDHAPFCPDEKHRRYWAEYPLPVALILHDPTTMETIWTDARQALRVHGVESIIRVPRANLFDDNGVTTALACNGPLPSGPFEAEALLRYMATPEVSAQGLCFLYLFAQGMTDIANSLYFSMDVVDEILDVVSATRDPPSWRVGPDEYAFIDLYVDFLVQHDLARVDHASWKQPQLERDMVGKFIAPLTDKGRQLRDLISAIDDDLPECPDPYGRAIRERLVQMRYNPTGIDEMASRQHRIEEVRVEIVRRASEVHPPGQGEGVRRS